jgi:hypothetical protein
LLVCIYPLSPLLLLNPLSPHLRLSLLALLPLALFAVYAGLTDRRPEAPGAVDLGIQLTEPAAVTFTVARSGNARLIDVSHAGSKPIAVSVPTGWTRTEVRGVPLSQVEADEPSMGYVRWRLPPGGVVTFRAREPFDAIVVHNPSDIPLTARLTALDLDLDASHTDGRLVRESAVILPLRDDD